MEADFLPTEIERIELIRAASRVFAELTEIQNIDILVR